MKTMQKTLLTIVAALTFAGCVKEKKPELENYEQNRYGDMQYNQYHATISCDSTGKAYKIAHSAGDIAIDTNATHDALDENLKTPIVLNPKMVELATNIVRDQNELSYLLDSAMYARKHK